MELVDSTFVLSDFTKKTLTQFGWKEGDAIPTELGPMLVKIRESLPPSPRNDLLVDIAAMAEEDIATAKAMLAEAKELASKKAAEEKKEKEVANLNPAAKMMYQQMNQLAENAEIIDDRDAPVEPVTTAPPPQPDATPSGAVEVAPDAAPPGPMAILPFCPRCGWDMRQKFEIVPTDLDKEDFVAAILGNVSFKRDYTILGGKVRFTFHTILAEQNKMLHRQLVIDQDQGVIKTEAEWFVQMFEYRLALSLEAVYDGKGKLLHAVPALGETPGTDDFNTPLVVLKNHVNNTVLAHEVTRRLVGQHLRQFQRLVEALEAMALEPSFWEGIAQQP